MVLCLGCLRAAGTDYGLESLVGEGATHPAPRALQQAMRELEKSDLEVCQEARGYSDSEMASSFSAIAIDLGGRSGVKFLVFPSSTRCTAFFGAHAIAFWVMAQDKEGHFTLLLKGREDSVEILRSKHKGLFDIRTHYNSDSSLFRFDGTRYVPSRR